jgi:hypothetical protein
LGFFPLCRAQLFSLPGLSICNSFLPDADPSELTVEIFDCFVGKTILLHPGAQSAVVAQSCADLQTFQPSEDPYSYKLTRFLRKNTDPNVTVEDLGYKRIQDVKVHGIRITSLGGEKDGDLKGKPAKLVEEWMSDDLGVTLLWVYTDLAKRMENRVSVTTIRREEPGFSLFHNSIRVQHLVLVRTSFLGGTQNPKRPEIDAFRNFSNSR